jgi:large subunit ribosomal protein L21
LIGETAACGREFFPPRQAATGTATMFAIIKTGGKQYRVAAQDVITVEKLAGNPGDTVAFADVLLVGGDTVVVGCPTVAGATVAGELVEHGRGDKVIVFKKRRRKNSRRKRGHRQEFSVIRITEIRTEGKPAESHPPAA